MKKLLSFLAIVGLTTTATTSVIACTNGSKENPAPSDGEETSFEQLLQEYKDEINSTFSNVITKNATKLVMKVDTTDSNNDSGYHFLNYENLKKYIDDLELDKNHVEIKLDKSENQEDFSNFQADLYDLYPESDWNQEIGNRIGKFTKFQNLIPKDGTILGGYQIDDITVEISRDLKDLNDFTINISSNFKRSFNYLSEDGITPQNFSSSKYLTAMITSNQSIINVVNQVRDVLPTQLASEANANGGTQFNYSGLKTANENLKAYGYIDDAIVNAINNTDETTGKVYHNIVDFINRTLQTEFNNNTQVTLSEDLANPDTFSTIASYLGDSTWTNSLFVSDLASNPFMNKLIFNSKNGDYLDEDIAVNNMKDIFVNIKNSNFDNSLTNFLKVYVNDQQELNSLANMVYSYGYFNLDNIKIQISDSYPSITIPTISIPWVYEADLSYGTSKETNFLGAYYDALKVVNQHTIQLNALDQVNKTLFEATDSFKDAFLGDLVLQGINDTSDQEAGVSMDDINQYFNEHTNLSYIGLGTRKDITGHELSNYFTFSKIGEEINKDSNYQFEGYDTFVQDTFVSKIDQLVIRKTSDGRIGFGYKGAIGSNFSASSFSWKQNIGNSRMNFYFPFGFNEYSNSWHNSDNQISELVTLKSSINSNVDDFLLWELN